MRGLVLAAGLGTRLAPITDHIPKALVTVCGIPVLERHLVHMRERGIGPLGANTHHLPGQIEAFRDSCAVEFELFHERGRIRGTGGALDFAREWLGRDDAFCVCNADILSTADIGLLGRRFLDSGAECMLIAASPRGRGTMLYDQVSGLYQGVPADTSETAGLAGSDYIGLAFYRSSFLDLVRRDDFSVVPVWQRARKAGREIVVETVSDLRWHDIGRPSALARAHFDVLSGAFDLAVRPGMLVDKTAYRAFPAGLPPGLRHCVGPNAWVEATDFDPAVYIENAVVLIGATVPAGTVRDAILTEWGGVPFA